MSNDKLSHNPPQSDKVDQLSSSSQMEDWVLLRREKAEVDSTVSVVLGLLAV